MSNNNGVVANGKLLVFAHKEDGTTVAIKANSVQIVEGRIVINCDSSSGHYQGNAADYRDNGGWKQTVGVCETSQDQVVIYPATTKINVVKRES